MTSSRSSRRAVLGMLGAAPLAAGGLLAVPATAEARAGSAGHNPVPPELLPGGTLDKLIAQRAAADQYSGTVLLLHDGHPVLSRSYGMADKQLSIGNGPETIFALGSITKLFTGIAIAQLVQQGKVAYHEKLGAYLDGFPAEVAGTVTVHQLLTHTAGMGDVYRDSGDIMHPPAGPRPRGAARLSSRHRPHVQQQRLHRPRLHRRRGLRPDLLRLRAAAHLPARRHDQLRLLHP
jgi:CubicO group peptidase (beta-lactamase class C family)